MATWPESRPGSYDETLVYDEEAGTWGAVDGKGGSRYQSQFVAVGYDDDGNGVIYYGAVGQV